MADMSTVGQIEFAARIGPFQGLLVVNQTDIPVYLGMAILRGVINLERFVVANGDAPPGGSL
jgi:hypothetical protein